ncbi:hypothetical protein FV242_03835 [Methylobacterium sp. WL64]|nr:hypothetical protein FV242_03835 [Methylobacterium sp. WL64]
MAPARGSGEGQRDGAGFHLRRALSGYVAPLSRPASRATLPRRGGRESVADHYHTSQIAGDTRKCWASIPSGTSARSSPCRASPA